MGFADKPTLCMLWVHLALLKETNDKARFALSCLVLLKCRTDMWAIVWEPCMIVCVNTLHSYMNLIIKLHIVLRLKENSLHSCIQNLYGYDVIISYRSDVITGIMGLNSLKKNVPKCILVDLSLKQTEGKWRKNTSRGGVRRKGYGEEVSDCQYLL